MSQRITDRRSLVGCLPEEHPSAPVPAARPSRIRAVFPHPARMYDYYLGGKNNFATDRGAAEAVLALAPEVRAMAFANRAFLRRAVSFATGLGIRQFLDIGVGLPAAGDTYECALLGTKQARAVYVDKDPMVLAHARALSDRPGRVCVVDGDLRNPGALLERAAGRGGLDFDRPVAVVLTAVLHYLSDADDPWSAVGRVMAATKPGSVLLLSHAAADLRPEAARTTAAMYRQAAAPLFPRTAREVGALFTGLNPVEPGVTPVASWRADRLPRVHAERQWMYAGVGVKPPSAGRWQCSSKARGIPAPRRSCL
ncbi:SAM-dependent methyltransferase [Embleya sp. NPDC005575]|uniref:SAM-dependent methyltransferase n=1 Tax=Embleya sp. NPDC005575 TaxID=3156892 RepID=UPI0033AA22EA